MKTLSESVFDIKNGYSSKNCIISEYGWYRIAKYNCGSAVASMGSAANGCGIILKRQYNHANNEYHHVELAAVYQRSEMRKMFSISNAKTIAKIRHTASPEKMSAYIEVLYTQNASNFINTSIIFGSDGIGNWTAIEAEPVQEDAEGFSVYSEIEL